MKNESKQKQKQKKQKHIFIRVDKPIEPGDLVRCVEHDWPCKGGDIRKVRRLSGTEDAIFFIHGSFIYLNKTRWEPVHKLKVGDLVEHNKDVEPREVTAVNPELNYFWTGPQTCAWTADENVRLYQKPKTEWDIGMFPIEPVNYGLNKTESVSFSVIDEIGRYQTAWSEAFHEMTRDINQRKNMKRQVAEMVVELMDQETTISLGAYSDIGLTMVEVLYCGQSIGEAELHPNDTWDTLTGLYVALSKATGRDLPDWIYGKEEPHG